MLDVGCSLFIIPYSIFDTTRSPEGRAGLHELPQFKLVKLNVGCWMFVVLQLDVYYCCGLKSLLVYLMRFRADQKSLVFSILETGN